MWGASQNTGKPIGAAVLHWTAWAQCLVCCMVPASLWRGCPSFWRAFPEAVLAGTFKQLNGGGPLGPGLAGLPAVNQRKAVEAIAAAEHMCLVVKAGQSFMRDLGRAHEETVIFFHMEIVFLCRRGVLLWLLSGCQTWSAWTSI